MSVYVQEQAAHMCLGAILLQRVLMSHSPYVARVTPLK